MQQHTLKRKNKNKKAYKVGRGGKHAKTAGRGTKGQNARAGRKKRPELRDFIKRFPKLRGRGKNINTSIEQKAYAVSLSAISGAFENGATVSLQTLHDKGLVQKRGNVMPKVKILAGTVDKKLSFAGLPMSASARKAIETAGGSIA